MVVCAHAEQVRFILELDFIRLLIPVPCGVAAASYVFKFYIVLGFDSFFDKFTFVSFWYSDVHISVAFGIMF